MFRLHQWMVTVAVVIGYAYVTIQVFDHLTNIPIVYPALLLHILAQTSALRLKSAYSVFYWLLYSIFVFQLVSFHENDICIRNACRVTTTEKYIALASTGFAIIQPTPKPAVPAEIPVAKNVELTNTDSVKLVFQRNQHNIKWV